jgi:radical SAM protein (TIGR01212 family)
MERYHSYSSFLKKRFGATVLKVPLNAGFTCPNRDGSRGRGGCTFCDNRSFSPAAWSALTPVDQLASVIGRPSNGGKLFIAYLQPYSNTYAPLDRLMAVYEPLLAVPRVVGLSIGTRPDCFSDGVYDYLDDCAGRTYLSIELGLQSAHDRTLSQVNRGHTFAEFARTAERLAKLGIETVAHVMIGLPGESAAMIFETATALSSLPVNGVKIHQLMIIRGTPLAERHGRGEAPVLAIGEYAPILCGFIERLRPDQLIHRIMADSRPENGLIAPAWSACKQASIVFLHNYMDQIELFQGRLRP